MESPAAQRKGFKAGFREEHGREATAEDVRYHTILGSLLRMKMKIRVLPSRNDGLTNSDHLWKDRIPDGRGTLLTDAHPPDYPYACKPHCETCFTQSFPGLLRVSNDEALANIRLLTDSIDDNMTFLQTAIRDHADFILTRWKKKSVVKRTQLLSTLYPDAAVPFGPSDNLIRVGLHDKKWAPVHLIDLRSGKKHSLADSRKMYPGTDSESLKMALVNNLVMNVMEDYVLEEQKVTSQTTWLLPYLDVESLAEDPLLFLSLLYHRTAHTPVRHP